MSDRLWFAAAIAAFALHAFAADPLPPKARLTQPPLQVLDELAKADGAIGTLGKDERAALNAAWERRVKAKGGAVRLSDDEQVELFLHASGVDTADKRKEYRAKIADLRKACGEKLDGLKEETDRGEAVFQFVHTCLGKGYKLEGTSLIDLFESEQYNCVSVSALLYLVGKDHGLDLRPMVTDATRTEIGHTYLEWQPSGKAKRSVVEGTVPTDGFRWVDKMNVLKQLAAAHELKIFSRGREVDGAGLAGQIYSNRAAFGLTGRDFATSARSSLAAFALDPTNGNAEYNFVVAVYWWGSGLIDAGECNRADRVYATALAAAPIHPVLHEGYIRSAFVNKDDAAVVARVATAREKANEGGAYTTAAGVYTRYGLDRGLTVGWQEGLAAFDRGLKAVPANEQGGLVAARGLYLFGCAAVSLVCGDVAGTARQVVMAAPPMPIK